MVGVRLGCDSEVEFELIFVAVGGRVAVGDEVNAGQNAAGLCAGVIGNSCAPFRRIASNEVIGLCAKGFDSLPSQGGIDVIGSFFVGASGSAREGDLKPVMRGEIVAAGARCAEFDFDSSAGQEGREVRPTSEECYFGWRLSSIGLKGERNGQRPGLIGCGGGPMNGGWLDERNRAMGRDQ